MSWPGKISLNFKLPLPDFLGRDSLNFVLYIYFFMLDWSKYLLILSMSTLGSSFKCYMEPSSKVLVPGLITMYIFLKNYLNNCCALLTIPTCEQYRANLRMEQSFVCIKDERSFSWWLISEESW
jgi:hypothetical protein